MLEIKRCNFSEDFLKDKFNKSHCKSSKKKMRYKVSEIRKFLSELEVTIQNSKLEKPKSKGKKYSNSTNKFAENKFCEYRKFRSTE